MTLAMGDSKKKKKERKEKRRSSVREETKDDVEKSAKKRKVSFAAPRDVPVGFEEVEAQPLLTGLKADSKNCEIWLLQVPAEMEDLSEMNGVTMDVSDGAKGGIVGSLQKKGGGSFHVVEETADAAGQMIVDAMVPEDFPAKVAVQKRVMLVRNWGQSEGEGVSNDGAEEEGRKRSGSEVAVEAPDVEIKEEEELERTPLHPPEKRRKSKSLATPKTSKTPKTPKSAKSGKKRKGDKERSSSKKKKASKT